MLLANSHAFQPVDMKRRIFHKLPRGNQRERLPAGTRALGEPPFGFNPLLNHVRVREAAFDTSPVCPN